MTEPVLEVEGLTVRYGRVEAVRDVSFQVAQGSLVTLVGANGAGKSTVINAVSGIVRPHGGRIRFRGTDITRAPAHRLVARGLVQVPEGRQILATLTVAENLAMGGWHRGRAAARTIDEMYQRFGVLAERRGLPAGTLSGAPKPRALQLLDEWEPTERGPYGGVVGYFDLAGNMDMAINIRSATLHRGQAHVQAGAGIVADSDPDAETAETVTKATAPLRSVLTAGELGQA